MLLWFKTTRWLTWALFTVLFAFFFGLPLITVLLASVSGQWNGILPSSLTLRHFTDLGQGASASAIITSLVTALLATLISLTTGAWAAFVVRSLRSRARQWWDILFLMPIAVPSVSVGLMLLVAFSQPPVVLNGTISIVLVAHVVLVTAFSYSNVAAGLARIPLDQEQVAASLGASPLYVLFKITLPLLIPQLMAAASLAFALSMGELGATIMVYPPGWVTMPVHIFGLTDRGDVFSAAALAVLLIAFTFIVLAALSRVRTRASFR